jgi:hypothetical protein
VEATSILGKSLTKNSDKEDQCRIPDLLPVAILQFGSCLIS